MFFSLYAGLDFSGRASLEPKLTHDYLIACLIALEDEEALKIRFDALRLKVNRNTLTELHGKKMEPLHIAEGLRIGNALKMKVTSLCIDKTATYALGMLPLPQDLYRLVALKIWDDALRDSPIARLTYDTEIEGKSQQKVFESEIKRRSRSIYPTQKVKLKSLPSHKSDLIQLADIVAYELQRQYHNKKIEPCIKVLMEQIEADPRSIIRGPQIWIP